MALNAKPKQQLWTLKWKCGSERRNEDNICEGHVETMALNAKLKLIIMNAQLRKMTLSALNKKTWWLWTPSWKMMVALNAETENTTLNIELKTDDGSERWN